MQLLNTPHLLSDQKDTEMWEDMASGTVSSYKAHQQQLQDASQLMEQASVAAAAAEQNAAAFRAAAALAQQVQESAQRGLVACMVAEGGASRVLRRMNDWHTELRDLQFQKATLTSMIERGALHASTGPKEPKGPQYLRFQPNGSAADSAVLSELEQLLLQGAAHCGLEVHGSNLDFSTPAAATHTAESVIQLWLQSVQEETYALVARSRNSSSNISSINSSWLYLSGVENIPCGKGGFAGVYSCRLSNQHPSSSGSSSKSSREAVLKVPTSVQLVIKGTKAMPCTTRRLLKEWHCQLLAAGVHVAEVGAAGSIWVPVVFSSLSPEQQLEALKQLEQDVEAARMLLESATVSQQEAAERVPMPQIGPDTEWFVAISYMELRRHSGSLADVILHRQLAWQEKLRVILKAAECVFTVHACGVNHRDIKPANFLVGRADGCNEGFRDCSMCTSELYLADFGLADERGYSREVSGSSGFAAPEQGRGQQQDHKVDSYAFGVTILHVLVGYATARELLKLPPGTQDKGARTKAHDAVGVKELVRANGGCLPGLTPEVTEEAVELLEGTLAFHAKQRWCMGEVMDCRLLGRGRRGEQQLQDPKQRGRLLKECLAVMQQVAPEMAQSLSL